MALFQKSVLDNHLKLQDQSTIEKAYKKFTAYFHNPAIQQNIKESKEEQFQEGFLRELFVKVLGYTLNPEPNFNLTTELKNEKGAKKADGAILKEGQAVAVIELKSTKTKDLESIRQQAFDYKANQTGCVYVVTSNFEKLRFYVNNAVEFEEFNLFNLPIERFALMYLCLHQDNLLSNKALDIKTASVREEESITKKFYSHYSVFKRELYRDLVKQNITNEVFRAELAKEDTDRAKKKIKLTLFKKSQKLIDRFLFIFFGEDRHLLPPNSTIKILEDWNKLKDLDAAVPLYDRFKLYFNYLDKGRKGTEGKAEIFAYNGGLFQPDPVLDSLHISDELLYKHTEQLSRYNFDSQIDVNILGHIFENSLNEIESVNAEIEGVDFDKQTTKRKKDGVFYTPKYITKYIVDNTVGKLCTEKKAELGLEEEAYFKSRKGRTAKKLKELQQLLETYREWMLTLTILDPACGSGAFLNQALDFLIKEHRYIDELETSLLGGAIVYRNIENTILENNIYGVDLNEESVEIAKLSLWLRTAQPRRKLTVLSSNIKCGNSLIDDPKVAGDKAFHWQKEFPEVFSKKEKVAWHITTATHDSRTSQRMVDLEVRKHRDNGNRPKAEGIWLEPDDELLITKMVATIVKEDKLNVMAYNICGDHMHLLLVCEEDEVPKIVGKIKAVTSKEYNTEKGITTRGHVPLSKEEKKTYNSLWTQKFGCKKINSEEQLWNTVAYIQTNREKHELPEIAEITAVAKNMCCTYDHAFDTEYAGGFDVVIGNPPYVYARDIEDKIKTHFIDNFKCATYQIDLYVLFLERSVVLVNTKGLVSFIIPNTWLNNLLLAPVRNYLLNTVQFDTFVSMPSNVFEDANVDTVIATYNTNDTSKPIDLYTCSDTEFHFVGQSNQDNWIKNDDYSINVHLTEEIQSILKKMELSSMKFGDISEIVRGVGIYHKRIGHTKEFIKSDPYQSNKKENETFVPYLRGRNLSQWEVNWKSDSFISYGNWLAEPREPRFFNGKRILIRKILAKGIVSAYMEEQFVVDQQVYTAQLNKDGNYDEKALVGIICSKLMSFYFRYKYSEFDDLFPQIKLAHIKGLPIKELESNELTIHSKKLIELKINYRKISGRFGNYIQSQFSKIILNKKLQNWHKLEFSEFINELNKAIKKAGGEKLSKMDEMEWMEVFETKKEEAQNLKAQIDKTDKEIDQMVYELYGLSEEEIRIVEGN